MTESKERKDVLRKLTYGLYIATTRDADTFAAAGISWLSQCSFDPPLVMLALRKEGLLARVARRSGRIVVHVLGADQQEIAKSFFGAIQHEPGKLNSHPYRLVDDLPVLEAAPWHFVVDAREWVDRGDHAVLIGAVSRAGIQGEAKAPLRLADTPWSYGG